MARTWIDGVVGAESLQHVGRFNGSVMSWIACTVEPVRMAKIRHALWSSVHLSLKLLGHSTSLGWSTAFQPAKLLQTSPMNPSKMSPRVCNTSTWCQLTCVNHSVFSGFSSFAKPGNPVIHAVISFSFNSLYTSDKA